jgi:hypothetical protein
MATNIAKTRRCLDPAGVSRADGLQAQAPEAAFASSPMRVTIPNARLFAVYLPQKEGEEPCPFLPASIRRRPAAISDEMGKYRGILCGPMGRGARREGIYPPAGLHRRRGAAARRLSRSSAWTSATSSGRTQYTRWVLFRGCVRLPMYQPNSEPPLPASCHRHGIFLVGR